MAGLSSGLSIGQFNFEKFDTSKTSWTRWLQHVEGAFQLMKLEDDGRKLLYVLHYMGQENYDNLCDYMDNVNLCEKTYGDVTLGQKLSSSRR